MATNKKTTKKKTLLQNTPLLLTLCAVIALAVGLVIGLLIPTPGANIPYTPLNSVKVENLTVNTINEEAPVTLQFKLNGLPKDTQLNLMIKQGNTTKYLDCTYDGNNYGCNIESINEKPTHVTLVLVHEGASIYLPLVRNLSRVNSSVGYLVVWDYQ